MIYLSCQPDDYYFLWQLQIQIFNFNSVGILPENIHVLIGYDPHKGLSDDYFKLVSENKQALFFLYPDTRSVVSYISTIRPHIIAKHFNALPKMKNKTIFYHDSDIIFTRKPDFKNLEFDDVWYASDTSTYLNSEYIKGSAGNEIFESMCNIVGVCSKTVENNNSNSGGAQYILKNTTTEFWNKIEKDSESLYNLLELHNRQNGYCQKDNGPANIQSWCADMWAIWMNALALQKTFRIHDSMTFSWVNSHSSEIKYNQIIHYSGSVAKSDKTLFRKSNYKHYPPFFEDLSTIDNSTCSYLLRDLITSYVANQNKNRINLKDVSFIIPVRIDSQDRYENLYAITKYIDHHFDTSILIIEADTSQKIDNKLLPKTVQYFFVKDTVIKFHRTKYINYLISKAKTDYISIYDTDVIVPHKQILQAVMMLRDQKCSMVSPYDGSFITVDRLLKAMFIKLNDDQLLETNKGKFVVSARRSFGGAIFINRKSYISAGMENEKIRFWGPDDIERVKRMQILGYVIKRVNGNLYHLPHERGVNSMYVNIDEQDELMVEFIRISSMEKPELVEYIKMWNHHA